VHQGGRRGGGSGQGSGPGQGGGLARDGGAPGRGPGRAPGRGLSGGLSGGLRGALQVVGGEGAPDRGDVATRRVEARVQHHAGGRALAQHVHRAPEGDHEVLEPLAVRLARRGGTAGELHERRDVVAAAEADLGEHDAPRPVDGPCRLRPGAPEQTGELGGERRGIGRHRLRWNWIAGSGEHPGSLSRRRGAAAVHPPGGGAAAPIGRGLRSAAPVGRRRRRGRAGRTRRRPQRTVPCGPATPTSTSSVRRCSPIWSTRSGVRPDDG
jgi:hypothetical protein